MKFTEIFTFLKENKVYAEARARVADLLATKKEELKAIVEQYLKDKSPIIKEGAIAFIMDHIELKFPYKLFKGTIKKAISKNFDKLVEFILVKLQEL
jgi:Glu-tRNA(Gln) amidotransferase subunit E-like FAD-binding protein